MPKHSDKRIFPYDPDQVFDLVADVEAYPEFLPWCVGARLRSHAQNEEGHRMFVSDLIIRFKMFREKFTSRVTLHREGTSIKVEYLDGPFEHLHNEWRFAEHPDGTELEFEIDFKFRNFVLNKLITQLFEEAVSKMVAAFEARAEELYG